MMQITVYIFYLEQWSASVCSFDVIENSLWDKHGRSECRVFFEKNFDEDLFILWGAHLIPNLV